jgi:outer membrane protein OmpA-like peptidoglycan-associated protein
MKTKIITLTWIALLLLIVNSDTFGNPYIRFAKPSHRSVYKMSIAEMTQNLHFGFAKANFNSKYNDQLDQLAKALIDGDYAVVLRGHADSIGTYVGNWKLSQKRADSIKSYLMKKGVADRKIVTTPLGSTTPIATNKTREGRQKNRRVEIKISKVNS